MCLMVVSDIWSKSHHPMKIYIFLLKANGIFLTQHFSLIYFYCIAFNLSTFLKEISRKKMLEIMRCINPSDHGVFLICNFLLLFGKWTSNVPPLIIVQPIPLHIRLLVSGLEQKVTLVYLTFKAEESPSLYLLSFLPLKLRYGNDCHNLISWAFNEKIVIISPCACPPFVTLYDSLCM